MLGQGANAFLATLGQQLGIHQQHLHGAGQKLSASTGTHHARRVIGDWIGFDNHHRPHLALGMRTPAEVYALAA